MSKITKILLVLALLLWIMPRPGSAATISPGDLIKGVNNSTVYYYGYDGKRHAFPNEKVYFSWYINFNNVKTVSGADLANIQLGKSVVVRPGTYLIKLYTNSTVYAVEPLGQLRAVPSVSQAEYLYGLSWQSRIIDLPDSFFQDYQVGQPLNNNQHPTGSVLHYTGEKDYYWLVNGYTRKFYPPVSWDNYRFNTKFILDLPYQNFRYVEGDDIDQFRMAIGDTAQTLFDGTSDNDLLSYSTGAIINSRQGLKGYYYNGTNFDTEVFNRIDNQVDFDWKESGPGSVVSSNNFSVRWVGKIKVDNNTTKTFYTYSDDGVRLYIDGNLIINDWSDHGLALNSGSAYLSSGYHNLKLEYYEHDGAALIRLFWNNNGEFIPSANLSYE
ncbi:MAG: PA14 domain-containing protein [Patescibacteria group bacterium]